MCIVNHSPRFHPWVNDRVIRLQMVSIEDDYETIAHDFNRG